MISSVSSTSTSHKISFMKRLPRCLFRIFKRLMIFIRCSSPKPLSTNISKITDSSSNVAVKKTQKQARLTISSAIRNDGIKKGCTYQKLDYLVKLLIKDKDDLIWADFPKLSHSNVQGKSVILQCVELTSKKALKNYQKGLVNCFSKVIEFGEKSPNKIFIPFAYEHPIPHGMLIVVEPSKTNPEAARITLVDSLGDSNAYRETLLGFATELQKLFPSDETTVVCNKVRQQRDGLTCGFHVLENILLLAKQENAEGFVKNGELPKRSKKDISKRLQKYVQKMDQ